jgi:hypothetical protein
MQLLYSFLFSAALIDISIFLDMFSFFCQVLLCSDCKGVSGGAVIMYSLMWFRLQIKASVRKPLLVPKGEGDKQRLPVVIFSHGMWACRTTYSSTCIDVASHGYSYGRFLHCSPVSTPFLCASVEHQMNECVYYTCLWILWSGGRLHNLILESEIAFSIDIEWQL